jgi:hypothetical protein
MAQPEALALDMYGTLVDPISISEPAHAERAHGRGGASSILSRSRERRRGEGVQALS